MSLTILRYPNSLISLRQQMNNAAHFTPTAELLVDSLIEGAAAFDMTKVRDLGLHFRYKGLTRNAGNPVSFEHPEIAGMPWSDNPATMLEPGETWNAGRRATMTGQRYDIDPDRKQPVNPYMDTGLNGRGILGGFGPNLAVDNGMIVVRDDTLYMPGITRKYDNDAPAMAGGFAKFSRNADGSYRFDREETIRTRTEECFEEMISGSIALLPEFSARVDGQARHEIDGILARRPGKTMDDGHRATIREQVITELKMEQVRLCDPGFMERLEHHIRKGVECFAGPVLNDPRTTNTAWIESRVAWIEFNDDIWNGIRGRNPVFDYRLAGGDDASGVVYHKFGPELVEKAYASHGAMMTFMAASFLIAAQDKKRTLPVKVMKQLEDTALFLSSYRSPAAP